MTKRELESENARLREQNAALTKMLADALARPVVPILLSPSMLPTSPNDAPIRVTPFWQPPVVTTPNTGTPLPMLPYTTCWCEGH